MKYILSVYLNIIEILIRQYEKMAFENSLEYPDF